MPVSPESEIGIAYGQGRTAADALALPTTNPYSDATILGKQQRAAWFQGYYDAIRDQNIRILQSGLAFLLQPASGQVLLPPGTPVNPGIAFVGSPGSGWYLNSLGDMGLSVAGAPVLSLGTVVRLRSDGTIRWSSTTDPTGAFDLGFRRRDTFTIEVINAATMGTIASNGFVGVTQQNGGGSTYFSASSASTKVDATRQFGWSATADNAGAAGDAGFGRVSAGVIKVTGFDNTTRGLLGGGAAVASAAALPLPTGRVFHVTGSVTITSITSTNFSPGCVITMIFDAGVTVTHGGNIILAGAVNFVATANDTLTMAFDGVSWFEVCRSVN